MALIENSECKAITSNSQVSDGAAAKMSAECNNSRMVAPPPMQALDLANAQRPLPSMDLVDNLGKSVLNRPDAGSMKGLHQDAPVTKAMQQYDAKPAAPQGYKPFEIKPVVPQVKTEGTTGSSDLNIGSIKRQTSSESTSTMQIGGKTF